MNRKTTIASIITLFLVIVLVTGCAWWQKEEPVARGPQTKCYKTSGGDKWICGSGGEFELQSGSILDVQAGATAVWAGAASFTGQSSFTGAVSIAATPAATATPQVLISDVGAGVPLEIRNANATPEVAIDGGYELDMNANEIVNIGAAGTDFSATGGLTLADILTITAGGLTLSDGDAVVADDVRVTAQTAITVTNATAFTATGTYQGIQAAGWVTPTIAAGTAGDLLILVNVSAQNITIEDTGVQMLTAVFVMGQYDVLMLLADGTNWIEVSRANN
jgi:hypothetical protein